MRAAVVLSIVVPAVALGTAGGVLLARQHPAVLAPQAARPPEPAAPDAGVAKDEDERAFVLHIPSGEPARLSCEAARVIVRTVTTKLAYDPIPVSPEALAAGTADWLDPHGMWSAAPDSPIGAAIEQLSAPLLHELTSETGGGCESARKIGAAIVPWMAELTRRFDKERRDARDSKKADSVDTLRQAAEDSPFEDDSPTRSGRDLAELLGRRVGKLERSVGAPLAPFAEAARARFLPPLDAEGWQGVVMAAAVRAYIQVADPHGAWAPRDEEASVYPLDLELPSPARLWERASRTAIGVRMLSGPEGPLREGDIVLSISGLPTAGLPLEQVEQLGYAAAESDSPVLAVVLRPGEPLLRELKIGGGEGEGHPQAAEDDLLPSDRVPYASGDALVVSIHDVRDDLGDELQRALDFERDHEARPIEGLVLDLRGNGGGSMEGAIKALGLFLPGAPLFPMKRRDGPVPFDRAPEPPNLSRWTLPVATLVDGDTASAAEMIAGALAAYHRGPSVGSQTYGKGCAQEYIDDDADTGTLRLTTLIYALPDGSPVQRVGLSPSLLLGWGDENGARVSGERESSLSHAAPSWRGPDVRDRTLLAANEAFVWPQHTGVVGPCKDEGVCRALRALGASGKRAPTAKGHTTESAR